MSTPSPKTPRLTTRDWARWTLSWRAHRLPTPPEDEAPDHLGDLQLAPFQQAAASRLIRMVEQHHGALLADAVGLGKTRVSLTAGWHIARRSARANHTARSLLCCVPSRLMPAWRATVRAAGLEPDHDVQLMTHTALSRQPPAPDWDTIGCVLVDEAHRFRNPRAARARTLAAWAAHAPLLLVSATPVCNDADDLRHLLELFLRDDALRPRCGLGVREAFRQASTGAFDLSELVAQVVIRRDDAPHTARFGRRPSVRWITLGYEATPQESWLWQHLEPTLRRLSWSLFSPRWPFALLVEFVMRRWESGPEALTETLRELIAFHTRWREAAAQGRALTREGFRAIFGARAEQRAQEVMPFMLDPATPDDDPTDQLARALADQRVLESLLARVDEAAAIGWGRDRAILETFRAHPEKLLIFTAYEDAARGLYARLTRALGTSARVGLITGRGAQATGLGRANAWEIICRFAPEANDAQALYPHDHQRLDLLIATDCLAEGTNLQDCARIVLADLPYSPLGVEQRIGRLVRPGGAGEVQVMLPRPTDWNDSLGMRRRLEIKIHDADRAGVPFRTLSDSFAPRPTPPPQRLGPLEALVALDQLQLTHAPGAPALPPGQWYEAAGPASQAGLWAFAWLDYGDASRALWCHVSRETHHVTHQLADLIPALVTLLDTARPLRPWTPQGDLHRLALDHLHAQHQRLLAAHLAPLSLDPASPQARAWQRLSLAARDPHTLLNHIDLDPLRAPLHTPSSRGRRDAIDQLLHAHPDDPVALYDALAQLLLEHPEPPPSPRPDAPPGLVVLGGLLASPPLR